MLRSIKRFFSTRFPSWIKPDILVRLPVYLAILAMIVYLDWSNFNITIAQLYDGLTKELAALTCGIMCVAADILPAIWGRFSHANRKKMEKTIWWAFLITIVLFFVHLILQKVFSYDILFPAQQQAAFSFKQQAAEPEVVTEKTVKLRYIMLIGQGTVFPLATSVIGFALSALRADYVQKKKLDKLIKQHNKLESKLLEAQQVREHIPDPRDVLDEEYQNKLQLIYDYRQLAKTTAFNEFFQIFSGEIDAEEYLTSLKAREEEAESSTANTNAS